MRRLIFITLILIFSFVILCTGCSGNVTPEIHDPVTDGEPKQPETVSPVSPDGSEDVYIFSGKIVDINNGSLLLIPTSGEAGLYRLSIGDIEISSDLIRVTADTLKCGMNIEISYGGGIMDSYPMQFGKPSKIHVTGFEDSLVGFYLTVISDLYDVDPGLNSDIEMIAFDLSALTNLSIAEKSALMYLVSGKYGVATFEATFDELREQGLITGSFGPYKDDEPMEMPHFERGISIAFTDTDFRDDEFGFSVSKWRSALGAYFFSDCTAEKRYVSAVDEQLSGAEWVYEVGGHVIS